MHPDVFGLRAGCYWLFLESGPLLKFLGPYLAFELKDGRLAAPHGYPDAYEPFVDCIQKQLQWLHSSKH